MSMVEDLMSFTGLGRDEAATLLEASNFDLAAAATLYFEQQEGRSPAPQPEAVGSHAEQGISEDDYDMALEDVTGAIGMDPQEQANQIEQAAAAARAAEGAPVRDDGGYFDAYPRLRYCLTLLWRTPGVPALHSFCVGLGRFFYTMGLSGLGSLLLAPLRLLGLLPMQPRTPPGAPAVRRLESTFEANFGTTHPTFFRGTCQQAIGRSRTEAKFALICLCSPGAHLLAANGIPSRHARRRRTSLCPPVHTHAPQPTPIPSDVALLGTL